MRKSRIGLLVLLMGVSLTGCSSLESKLTSKNWAETEENVWQLETEEAQYVLNLDEHTFSYVDKDYAHYGHPEGIYEDEPYTEFIVNFEQKTVVRKKNRSLYTYHTLYEGELAFIISNTHAENEERAPEGYSDLIFVCEYHYDTKEFGLLEDSDEQMRCERPRELEEAYTVFEEIVINELGVSEEELCS